jgi:hypothetical protein
MAFKTEPCWISKAKISAVNIDLKKHLFGAAEWQHVVQKGTLVLSQYNIFRV